MTQHTKTRSAAAASSAPVVSRLMMGAVVTSAFVCLVGCSPAELSAADEADSPEVQAATLADPTLGLSVTSGRAQLQQIGDKRAIGAGHSFRAQKVHRDRLGQSHVRYDQHFRGVRVWGGEAVVHIDPSGAVRDVTEVLHGDIQLDLQPGISPARAIEPAHRDLNPRGAYVRPPTAELVVLPETSERVREQTLRGPGGELNAEDIEHVTSGYRLAYHVQTALENGAGETDHVDYLIDARSGEILKKWSTLQTAAATGTAQTQYSGSKSLGTNSVTGGFELRDVARGMNYATYNLNHATSGQGTIYTDTDNAWGDGANYVEGSSTTAANGQTAAADAHFGVGATYDLYKNVLGRNGIDGTGKATYSRVHYSNSYDNAFWDDTCFCMTYGDGSSFTTLTAIDVAGHEMTHGVTANTAKLIYSGESGGLNESTSDIFGTLVEFYSRGGSGATIGNTGGNWTIGEQLNATPLRYMYKPSKDGASPDAWSSTIGNKDVHYSSGPSNRMFYFLSQGSSSSSTSDFYSSYLPGGMTGIGNDHAAAIAYRALATYETSTTNYAGARTAYLKAATDLYGATSPDYAAVENAFAAINVGAPHGGGGGGGGTNLLQNPGFESGAASWTATAGVVTSYASRAHGGSYVAWLNGYGTTHTDSVYQDVAIPSTAASTTQLCYWLRITSSETGTVANDKLQVQLRNTSGTVLTTLASYSNLDKTAFASYGQKCFNVASYKGKTVRVYFTGTENGSASTSFYIDDTSLQ